MNSVLLLSQQQQSDDLTFKIDTPYRVAHIKEHLKLTIGDSFKANIVNRGIATASILSLTEKEIVVKTTTPQMMKAKSIHLVVGISRPPTMKKILEHGTSLGVTQFTFVPAQLSEKSYFTSKIYQEEQLLELLALGLEQSAYFSNWPMVSLEKHIPSLNDSSKKIILHPDVPDRWNQFDHHSLNKITLAVGPERGWTEDEISRFKDLGYHSMSMGSSRLRTEIAVFSALGHLL